MKKIGEIEIKVSGKLGNNELSPNNFDIKFIASLLQDIEHLLYPGNKKNRPIITYDIEKGSVRNIFRTSMQAIIMFNAIINEVNAKNSIDFLDVQTARAFENIQHIAKQKNFSFSFKTSLSDDFKLHITPQTNFIRNEKLWVDAEFYFYGILTNAGGKNKTNIHIDTDEYGTIIINTDRDFLKDQEKNLLYKEFGVRATGKQNVETGEMDTKTLKLIELIDYQPVFDKKYLNSLISKAKNTWKGIDANKWINDIRGDYEA